MATVADLRLRVLRRLGVLDHVRAPAAEEVEACDACISDVRAELLERGLCWWDAEDIPASVLPALTVYVAALAAGPFGKMGKGYDGERVENKARQRIAALKSTTARETVRGLYY